MAWSFIFLSAVRLALAGPVSVIGRLGPHLGKLLCITRTWSSNLTNSGMILGLGLGQTEKRHTSKSRGVPRAMNQMMSVGLACDLWKAELGVRSCEESNVHLVRLSTRPLGHYHFDEARLHQLLKACLEHICEVWFCR